MISLRKTMTELEGLSQRLQTALDCYRAALGSMEQHAVEIAPEEVAEHRQALRLIRTALEECCSEESLVGSRTALEAELERYSKRAAGSLKGCPCNLALPHQMAFNKRYSNPSTTTTDIIVPTPKSTLATRAKFDETGQSTSSTGPSQAVGFHLMTTQDPKRNPTAPETAFRADSPGMHCIGIM